MEPSFSPNHGNQGDSFVPEKSNPASETSETDNIYRLKVGRSKDSTVKSKRTTNKASRSKIVPLPIIKTIGNCENVFDNRSDETSSLVDVPTNSKKSLSKNLGKAKKQYVCDFCKKSFTKNSHLVRHVRQHTGEKPYKCKVCKRAFVVNATLLKHIRTHTGEKPYECDVCKKNYSHKSSLDIHKRTHIGEKPYQCNVCLKRFNQSTDLRKHSFTHTGEKPFQCYICKKGFSRKYRLDSHVKTLHATLVSMGS